MQAIIWTSMTVSTCKDTYIFVIILHALNTLIQVTRLTGHALGSFSPACNSCFNTEYFEEVLNTSTSGSEQPQQVIKHVNDIATDPADSVTLLLMPRNLSPKIHCQQ